MDQGINISVIITVYNIEKYIRECLDSVLCQKGVSFEVICVDDASSDHSAEILDEYAANDKRISVMKNEKNLGPASARNTGFRAARGEYLYSIDGDDMLVSGALERMYQCMQENNLDLLSFSAKSFFESEKMRSFGGHEQEYVRKKAYSGVKRGSELFAELMANQDRAANNIVLYCHSKKNFTKKNMYMAEGIRYADDSMFALYMLADRAMCIEDQLYLRRYREGSIVTSPMKRIYLENMVVLFWHELNIWRKMHEESWINKQIEHYFNQRQMEIEDFQKMFEDDKTEMDYLENHVAEAYFYRFFIERRPLYPRCISEEDAEFIRKAKHVVMYGAGIVAERAARILEYEKIWDYSVMVTTSPRNGKKFHGKSIREIADLKTDPDETVVIVAAAKKTQEPMAEKLREMGYFNYLLAKA